MRNSAISQPKPQYISRTLLRQDFVPELGRQHIENHKRDDPALLTFRVLNHAR